MKKLNMVKEKVSNGILAGAVKASNAFAKGKNALVQPFNNSLAGIDESGNDAGKIVMMVIAIAVALGVVALLVAALKTQITGFTTKLTNAAGFTF